MISDRKINTFLLNYILLKYQVFPLDLVELNNKSVSIVTENLTLVFLLYPIEMSGIFLILFHNGTLLLKSILFSDRKFNTKEGSDFPYLI